MSISDSGLKHSRLSLYEMGLLEFVGYFSHGVHVCQTTILSVHNNKRNLKGPLWQ